MMPELEVELDRIATGGAALGRSPDGKVVFVAGGLPGERVRASVVADHRTRVEADLLSVIDAAPGRRVPPCQHVEAGCGGCDWQHAEPDLQRELRRAIVVDCLTRLAQLDDVDVRLGPTLDPTGYRTTVRAAVLDGKAGFRAGRSHDVIPVDSCLVAHPLVDQVIADGRFGDASEVTIRAGANTGERLAIVTPTAEGVVVPDDVVVVGDDELRAGRNVRYHEEITGRRLRVSARSFFQCRPDGAEVLLDLVAAALVGSDGALSTDSAEAMTVLDAYCGVGLFGVGLAAADGPLAASGSIRVFGVESNRGAVDDAIANYKANGVTGSVARVNMERWRPETVTAVIADPARSGLGKKVSAKLAATGAEVIVLVSCDPASLARDAKDLAGLGYDLHHVTVVDLFGNTSHVETVSRLVRR
jgi:23S rRNA (uracil1939-C5)-methyltransferase